MRPRTPSAHRGTPRVEGREVQGAACCPRTQRGPGQSNKSRECFRRARLSNPDTRSAQCRVRDETSRPSTSQVEGREASARTLQDRKSTRMNSNHRMNSYPVLRVEKTSLRYNDDRVDRQIGRA